MELLFYVLSIPLLCYLVYHSIQNGGVSTILKQRKNENSSVNKNSEEINCSLVPIKPILYKLPSKLRLSKYNQIETYGFILNNILVKDSSHFVTLLIHNQAFDDRYTALLKNYFDEHQKSHIYIVDDRASIITQELSDSIKSKSENDHLHTLQQEIHWIQCKTEVDLLLEQLKEMIQEPNYSEQSSKTNFILKSFRSLSQENPDINHYMFIRIMEERIKARLTDKALSLILEDCMPGRLYYRMISAYKQEKKNKSANESILEELEKRKK